MDLLHQFAGGDSGTVSGRLVHRGSAVHPAEAAGGNRLSGLRAVGGLAGLAATGTRQRPGVGLVRRGVDSLDCAALGRSVRHLPDARAAFARSDCAAACAAQSKLRHGHADHRAFRVRPVRHHGVAAAVSADGAGIPGTGQRTRREPAASAPCWPCWWPADWRFVWTAD